MRLDKYVAHLWIVPRRQIKKLLKTGEVLLNSEIVDSPQIKIKEGDIIQVYDETIPVKFAVHILLHKPAWYISSNIDEGPYPSYKDLLQECPYGELVEIAWRLDVDTEGLLFCSSDGKIIHNIIHPHKKVEKEYFVQTKNILTAKMIQDLEQWVLLDGKKTLPATAEKIDETSLRLTITEGKFHQVKRMLHAVNNEVVYLRRDRIWSWTLDGIKKWEWIYIDIKPRQ